MNSINSLYSSLENRKDKINYAVGKRPIPGMTINATLNNLTLPTVVKSFYDEISFIKITEPMVFEITDINTSEFIDNRYLLFSIIGTERICFDTAKYNAAGEWDIICLRNKFIITKTLASYITNKIWAWIDRSRKIWEEEWPVKKNNSQW